MEYAKRNHDRYLSELREFLAIPTISTLTEHKSDVQQGAEWLSRQFKAAGLQQVEVIPTEGHPLVYGEWLGVPGGRTVLIYGHYDVQPIDPLAEWDALPFEPTLRGDYLFARGVSDMKSNGLAVLKAAEASLKNRSLPLNVKFLFEGEEEIGSPNLGAFLDASKSKLKCDLVLSADALITRRDLPSLAYGVRGMLYLEVHVQGPRHDLHSGEFGGAVHNPAQVLSELIAGMHDADGRVTLHEFYDKVRTLPVEERSELARIPYSEDEFLEAAGVKRTFGEKGYGTFERLGARPTLEVNGLLSGFTGQGTKTVLPARAMAKISMRLVPYQDPDAIEQGFMEYMRKNAPPTVSWEVKRLASADAALIDRQSFGMRAASAALESTFGVEPLLRLEGGTLPLVNLVKERLSVEAIMMGLALPDDNFHAPNERFYLPNYFRGIETYIHFFDFIAREPKRHSSV